MSLPGTAHLTTLRERSIKEKKKNTNSGIPAEYENRYSENFLEALFGSGNDPRSSRSNRYSS